MVIGMPNCSVYPNAPQCKKPQPGPSPSKTTRYGFQVNRAGELSFTYNRQPITKQEFYNRLGGEKATKYVDAYFKQYPQNRGNYQHPQYQIRNGTDSPTGPITPIGRGSGNLPSGIITTPGTISKPYMISRRKQSHSRRGYNTELIAVKTSEFGSPAINEFAFGDQDFGSNVDYYEQSRKLKPIPAKRKQRSRQKRRR